MPTAYRGSRLQSDDEASKEGWIHEREKGGKRSTETGACRAYVGRGDGDSDFADLKPGYYMLASYVMKKAWRAGDMQGSTGERECERLAYSREEGRGP